MIAGNGTLEAAKALGWHEITISRCPDAWDENTAKAYALADNRSSELAEWDNQTLASQLLDLDANGWNIGKLGFTKDDFEEIKKDFDDENPYTATVNVPHYEIVGEKPEVSDLADLQKFYELNAQIQASDISEADKGFLALAAYRHVVFNYKKIAEYYAHAPVEVQELMENSALVIIDFNNAIRNGYVKFADTIAELESQNSAGA